MRRKHFIGWKNRKPNIFETVTAHDLRHAFCCRCFEAGVHPKVVQALMGHADYAMTMNVYTHVSEQTISNESQKIVSLFDGADFTQLDMFLPKFNIMWFLGEKYMLIWLPFK